jgi:hypothetical protein
MLVVEQNFAEFSGELARDYFGKRHGEAALEGSGAVSSAHPRPKDEGVTAVERGD